MNYQSDKGNNVSVDGYGGQLVLPEDFKDMLSVEAQDLPLISINRVLDRA